MLYCGFSCTDTCFGAVISRGLKYQDPTGKVPRVPRSGQAELPVPGPTRRSLTCRSNRPVGRVWCKGIPDHGKRRIHVSSSGIEISAVLNVPGRSYSHVPLMCPARAASDT
jgi:hypothetical protein